MFGARDCGVEMMAIDIPNYRVIEKLGTGAQSRIFRARCMRTGKDYTVKIIKVVRPEDASFIELLRTEHAIGSSVDHPVIRKVFELRMMRHRLRVRVAILFMEYVDGISMADNEFRRPAEEVLRITADACRGLDAMHRAGFVHADIKPNNILVTTDNAVKLIDLGQSARIHEAKIRVQGTIDYMAPEQVQRGVLDQRTDVFAIGASLHRVLTGKPIKTDMNQTITQYSQSLVGQRVSEVNESTLHQLPACVGRLINDCCTYERDDRIADMPTLIKRIDLARTIVAKRTNGDTPLDDEQDECRIEDDEFAFDEQGDSIGDLPGMVEDADETDP